MAKKADQNELELLHGEVSRLLGEVDRLEVDRDLWVRRYRSLRRSAQIVVDATSVKREHEVDRLRNHLARLARLDRRPG